MCLRADKDVNSTYLDVRPLVHDEPGDKAIAAANIEHLGIGRKQGGKLLGQHAHPAIINVTTMDLLEEAH